MAHRFTIGVEEEFQIIDPATCELRSHVMQLVLDLLGNVRRSLGNELADVRAQFARRGVNDLEFFFDADGEAVGHGLTFRVA